MNRIELQLAPRPAERTSDPRAVETRTVLFRDYGDGSLRSDALFAVRYADTGRIYRRALVLHGPVTREPREITDRDFAPFRDCAPTLLGWAARPDLGVLVGIESDADAINDDPDYLTIRAEADQPASIAPAATEPARTSADLPHWGTRCRRCGGLDTAIRHAADGSVARVRAVGPGELRSDGVTPGFAPLAVPSDAYQCAACDAVLQGPLADDLFETTLVSEVEGDGIERIVRELRAEDAWQIVDFSQAPTARGTAYSGRLLRQGREVAWFEHQGNGGAMDLGILAQARENGDGEHLYREIRRLAGATAFEPEEPFILALLERQGL